MALCRCLCLSYWIPLLVQDSFRQASINLADLRKLTLTPILQLLPLELLLSKKHMMKWQTLRSGGQVLLESGKTEVQPNVLCKRSLSTIIVTAEHFHSPDNILQCTRDVLTNEFCKMKAKIHLLLKESLNIYFSLGRNSQRYPYWKRTRWYLCTKQVSCFHCGVLFRTSRKQDATYNSIV